MTATFPLGALEETTTKKPAVPTIYIAKYNKFVDNILEKMNDILRKSYDPVSVKLQPIDATKKRSKPKKNKNKNNKKKAANKKKEAARAELEAKNKDKISTEAEKAEKLEQATAEPGNNKVRDQLTTPEVASEARATKQKPETKPKPSKAKPTKAPAKSTTKAPTKTKAPAKSTKKPVATNNKVKSGSEKSKPRAKGTLYGLSSLRRTGDVAVNILSDHTTVKSHFAVGPLILRVEKEVGRDGKKEVKSATATTAEMMGKLTLRVNDQGIATLHSIKVLQPKQVRVDSNHERTRELAWQRSARIAHLVSEKLKAASKPMFSHPAVA
ncbi:hypothetical protein JYU34_012966 [Plutella xylostella]|uniref:Uncharacterized protein n=1 Tax=Plutella xylostella TaxID=51655 RepID=A0ABQ7QDX2_PLUXY|nr:hypothetical protein JYU34_012966 [Plutella xylostella]